MQKGQFIFVSSHGAWKRMSLLTVTISGYDGAIVGSTVIIVIIIIIIIIFAAVAVVSATTIMSNPINKLNWLIWFTGFMN